MKYQEAPDISVMFLGCMYNIRYRRHLQGIYCMRRKIFLFVLFLNSYLLLFSPVKSFGVEARITDFLITSASGNVLIYFRVKNCFTMKMEEAIQAGIPTTFTFVVELYQERDKNFDKLESSFEVKHTIKYDNIKKIFYVTYTEKGKKTEQFTYMFQAKTAMSDLNGFAVIPLKRLVRDKRYYVRVKAKLDKVRLPLHLEYVFFFLSLWDFETDWYRQDFIY